MIGKGVKKLIIVCDEKTEPYANYLRQLISVKNDKEEEIIGVPDGMVDAAVWLEKEYEANKATISSNEHILFVGDCKASRNETSSMIIRYEKYGMKYGWLGKRGMMTVDKKILAPDLYDQFIEYCKGYEADFEKIAMKRPKPFSLPQKKGKTMEIEANSVVEKAESEVISENENEPSGGEEKKLPAKGFSSKKLPDIGQRISTVFAEVGEKVQRNNAIAALGVANGINTLQVFNKIQDQQYRALSVILYTDGLNDFLEG